MKFKITKQNFYLSGEIKNNEIFIKKIKFQGKIKDLISELSFLKEKLMKNYIFKNQELFFKNLKEKQKQFF